MLYHFKYFIAFSAMITMMMPYPAWGFSSKTQAQKVIPHSYIARPYWQRHVVKTRGLKGGHGSPAVSTKQQLIFFGTSEGTILAVDTYGADRWKYIHGTPITGAALISEIPAQNDTIPAQELLFVGASNSEFLCLNAKTGRLLWKIETPNGIAIAKPYLEQAKSNNDIHSLYFSTSNGKVYCVNALTGKEQWIFTHKGIAKNITVRGHSGVSSLPHVDYLLTGFHDGTLTSINKKTGVANWSFNLSTSSIDEFGDLDATPLLVNNGSVAIAASVSDGVYALLPSNRNILWQREKLTQVTSMVAISSDIIAVGSAKGYIEALDLTTGATVWKFSFNSGEMTNLVNVGDYIFVANSNEGLLGIDKHSGKPAYAFDIGGDFITTPAILGPFIYVISRKGILYSLAHEQFIN